MDLTGFRTIIAAIVAGPLAAFSVNKLGLQLDAGTQTYIVGAVMAAAMIVMRVLTKTPVGKTVAQAHVDANAKLVAAGMAAGPVTPVATQGMAAKSAAVALVAMLLIPLLHGCTTIQAALGLKAKPTFNESIYAAYGTVDTIAKQTDTLLKAGKIKGAVASTVATQDANLKAALDIAKTTYATDQTDGGNLLQTAVTSLGALTTYLATLGVPAPTGATAK